jgi:transcriptional regulator with XRE-family HTH domain
MERKITQLQHPIDVNIDPASLPPGKRELDPIHQIEADVALRDLDEPKAPPLSPFLDESKMFGSLLKDKRHQLGLSQKDIGNKVGISPRDVSRIESGNIIRPKWFKAVKDMAQFYGMNVNMVNEILERKYRLFKTSKKTLATLVIDGHAEPKTEVKDPKGLTYALTYTRDELVNMLLLRIPSIGVGTLARISRDVLGIPLYAEFDGTNGRFRVDIAAYCTYCGKVVSSAYFKETGNGKHEGCCPGCQERFPIDLPLLINKKLSVKEGAK